jgi:aryl-alcohol dehydrogenase-like predicted oxidoreductase
MQTEMKYRKMGRTGLVVSEISLGTVNFGSLVKEAEAVAIVHKAFEAGINHFDTANVYPIGAGKFGVSEEILGKAVKPFRQEILITTKVGSGIGKDPNPDLSRRNILREVDRSLGHLQTDYIDIYMAHARDIKTPIDETLWAMDDLVRCGKVRYTGCSLFDPWEICKSLWISDKRNLARFDCVQTRYNAITRFAEFGMLPFCESEGLGVFAYNPLSGGLLAGAYQKQEDGSATTYEKGAPPPSGSRFVQGSYQKRYWYDRNIEAVKRIECIARRNNHTNVQAALAWLLHKKVTSVLTSVDLPEQLDQNLSAVGICLSDQDMQEFNEIYDAMLPQGWLLQEREVRDSELKGEFAF